MMLEYCTGCPITNKQHRVPPFGPAQTKIAFLGEAPGAVEVRQGRPFVGESGKLLRAAITACGRDPETFYYTNACKCPIPKGKSAAAEAVRACKVTLEEEFSTHGVETIIALGNTAMSSLDLPSEGITKTHGQVFQWRGLTVIPIYHPASVLYTPDRWNDFAEDLENVLSGKTKEKLPQFDNYHVIADTQPAIEYLHSLNEHPFVYFDLETSSLQLYDTHILCCGFATSADEVVILTDDALHRPKVIEALRELCANNHTTWGGHNAQFDAARFVTQFNAHPVISEDTLLEHYVLDERPGTHDLKQLARKYLSVLDWEADIKQWVKKGKGKGKSKSASSYANIPAANLWRYNACDVAYGFQLHNLLRPQVAAEKDLEKLYTKLLIPATNALVNLSVQGVKIDAIRLNTLAVETETQMRQLTAEMRDTVGDVEFNPASPSQVGHYLYQVAKAPPFSQSRPLPTEQLEALNVPRDRSDTTTAMDQLMRLAAGGYKCSTFAANMVTYRHAKTLLRTYLKNFIPESDGRVHPSYRLAGTVTGRLAGNDPNILNLPRDGEVRSLVVAEEGNVLVSVDYKACELRVLGALAHSESLRDMFKKGLDPHDETGKIIYGTSYNSSKHRVGVKQVNFGIAYGRGAGSIAEALSISYDDATHIRDTVLNFLGVAPWIEDQYRLVKTQGYVTTPTGRRRRFPLILDSNWHSIKRQAINAPVQGTSSDLCLMSLIGIDKWIRNYHGMVLFPTHDSILVEVPERYLDEVVLKIVDEMKVAGVRVFGPRFKTDVDIAVGKNYGKTQMQDFSLTEIGGVI